MPIYEFVCSACEKTFDHLAPSMQSSDAKVKCPHCNSARTQRQLSVFAVKNGGAGSQPAAGGGGMCGCGKMPGSCGMN